MEAVDVQRTHQEGDCLGYIFGLGSSAKRSQLVDILLHCLALSETVLSRCKVRYQPLLLLIC
jgi:hypothetical protein